MGTRLPEGSGILLPKEADLLIQVHYHRTGKPETDRTRIGLHFARKPVEKTWNTGMLWGMPASAEIPAGKAKHVEKGSGWLSADATVYSVMPHMHLLGKSVRITMTPPGDDAKLLLEVKEWDYNWQETYWLAKPLEVKAGTRFDIEAEFDNSDKNPNNPRHPPKTVTFGEQTTNEMLFGFFGMVPAGKDRVRILRSEPTKK
jgi:hypothetical protein